MKKTLFVFGMVLFLAAGCNQVALKQQPTIKEQNNNPAPAKPAGVKTFISEKLGMQFDYLASQGDPVIEQDDTVYVGGKNGQWVQEFSKNPNDDLKTAISKKFLAGIAEKDCWVEQTKTSNILTAQIKYEFTDLEDPRFTDNKCPADYRMTNGLRYFWMDTNHPDKFFFFSIGQYAILGEPDRPGGGEKTWQDTFKVIK